MKWLTITCLCCAALLACSALLVLRTDVDAAVPADAAAAPRPADRAAALQAARRSCDAAQLDRFVDEQRALARGAPGDAATLRLCAEALLERVVLRNQQKGMRVGEPLRDRVPAATATDVDDALELLHAARRIAATAADWRLEAALLGNRITGLASALQWNGRIEQALQQAARLDDRDPQLHVALGLRKLLAPRLLGHDPAAALAHFDYAARVLPDDERPRVFAAMAAWLLQKRQAAITWLEQAVAVNPNNVFAQAVLVRVRRDEPDPFGRDVGTVDAAATGSGR
jgi:tetratricopeptide (TPR) repeat protein